MEKESVIEISNINEELKALAAKDIAENRVRACLFNLILYADEESKKVYLEKKISQIIQNFPCRIIFIQNLKEAKEDFLKVSLSSKVYDLSGISISCDQLMITVSPNYLNRIPYLIHSTLVTDLPIYLFWGQDPTHENQILPYLQNIATKIIFDIENIENIQQFCKSMLNILTSIKIEIVDIQWILSNAWRNVFFEVFDSIEKIQRLKNTKKISILINKIENNHNYNCEIQSLYIQAWLASRMNWEFQSINREKNQTIIVYKSLKGLVEFLFNYEKNDNLPCGSIIGIQIEGEKWHVSMIRQSGTKNLLLHLSDENTCLLPYTLPLNDTSEGFNFLQQVFYGMPSLQYREMLQQLIKI